MGGSVRVVSGPLSRFLRLLRGTEQLGRTLLHLMRRLPLLKGGVENGRPRARDR